MTTVVEVDRHCAGRVHEDLFQGNDGVGELAETDSVEEILDR
jgi:hypothetical protein